MNAAKPSNLLVIDSLQITYQQLRAVDAGFSSSCDVVASCVLVVETGVRVVFIDCNDLAGLDNGRKCRQM
jgi:hypothetical protein